MVLRSGKRFDIPYSKVKRWRQKAMISTEWLSVVKKVKILRAPEYQGVISNHQ